MAATAMFNLFLVAVILTMVYHPSAKFSANISIYDLLSCRNMMRFKMAAVRHVRFLWKPGL